MNDIRVWKKLTIGVVGSVKKYREELERSGFVLPDWIDGLLKKTYVAKKRQNIDVVLVSVAELGFTEPTRYDEICRRAKEHGLALCPAEVGLALRLLYKKQPLWECLTIAMRPLRAQAFQVENSGNGRFLDSTHNRIKHMGWYPKERFVFVHPKS